MDDCRLEPLPSEKIEIVCAGQSESGMKFAAKYGDYYFISGSCINEPHKVAPSIARLVAEAKAAGRDCGALVLSLVIAEETADAAFAKWDRYKAGTDLEALARRASQAGADTSAGADSNINRFKAEGATLPANMVSFIGAHADMAQIDGVHGVMPVFDDYIEGIEKFGKFIQLLMKSRAGIAKAVA
jgi:pyrimidine oxygenase